MNQYKVHQWLAVKKNCYWNDWYAYSFWIMIRCGNGNVGKTAATDRLECVLFLNQDKVHWQCWQSCCSWQTISLFFLNQDKAKLLQLVDRYVLCLLSLWLKRYNIGNVGKSVTLLADWYGYSFWIKIRYNTGNVEGKTVWINWGKILIWYHWQSWRQ